MSTRVTNTNLPELSGMLASGFFRVNKGWLIFIPLILIFFSGCSSSGKMLDIQNSGEYEMQFYHDGSLIELWTDFDVEFVESITMVYQVSFYQGGELVAQVSCDPFDADEKRMQRYVETYGLVAVSYLGQMQGDVDLP
jgi:hypothetical protein